MEEGSGEQSSAQGFPSTDTKPDGSSSIFNKEFNFKPVKRLRNIKLEKTIKLT